jgi:hypothetical protein
LNDALLGPSLKRDSHSGNFASGEVVLVSVMPPTEFETRGAPSPSAATPGRDAVLRPDPLILYPGGGEPLIAGLPVDLRRPPATTGLLAARQRPGRRRRPQRLSAALAVTSCGEGPVDDRVSRGPGRDQLFGGHGNERLLGGPGAERFSAGLGSDSASDFSSAAANPETGGIP